MKIHLVIQNDLNGDPMPDKKSAKIFYESEEEYELYCNKGLEGTPARIDGKNGIVENAFDELYDEWLEQDAHIYHEATEKSKWFTILRDAKVAVYMYPPISVYPPISEGPKYYLRMELDAIINEEFADYPKDELNAQISGELDKHLIGYHPFIEWLKYRETRFAPWASRVDE